MRMDKDKKMDKLTDEERGEIIRKKIEFINMINKVTECIKKEDSERRNNETKEKK